MNRLIAIGFVLSIVLSLGTSGSAEAALSITNSFEASTLVSIGNSAFFYGNSASDTQEHYAVTDFTDLGGSNGIAIGFANAFQDKHRGGTLVGTGFALASAQTYNSTSVLSVAAGQASTVVSSPEPGTLFLVFAQAGLPTAIINSSVEVDLEPLSQGSRIFLSRNSSGVLSISDLSNFSIHADVAVDAVSGFPPGDQDSASGKLQVWWGFNSLPGSTPDNPLTPVHASIPILPNINSIEPFFPLTFPVTEDYGHNNFIYVDPAYATGYSYHVDGSTFSSFTIPNALPGGDDLFELIFGGMTFSLHAGDVFNFTDYVAQGINDFQLTGIDLGEQVDPDGLPPFVAGFEFTTEGVATLTQTPITEEVGAVPEPASMAIWSLGALGCAIAGYRRRKAA